MPDIGGLLGGVVSFIGEQVSDSSLRLGPVPTAAIFLIVLVLLSLVARPSSRWTVRDLGRLAAVGRAMALAAESGGQAAFSLGTAGIVRGVTAVQRIQTLAALPILAHVARAAAKAGVPLRVTANDPLVAHLGESVMADAHRRTTTQEREQRSNAEYLGEGRAVAAVAALNDGTVPAAGFVAGGLTEEALLLLVGASHGSAWTSFGTADASQASSVLMTGEGTMIGTGAIPCDQRPAPGSGAHGRPRGEPPPGSGDCRGPGGVRFRARHGPRPCSDAGGPLTMRRSLSGAIVIVAGLLLLVDFVVINPTLVGFADGLLRVIVLLAAAAALTGASFLAVQHGRRLREGGPNRLESAVLLGALVVMLVAGFYPGSRGAERPDRALVGVRSPRAAHRLAVRDALRLPAGCDAPRDGASIAADDGHARGRCDRDRPPAAAGRQPRRLAGRRGRAGPQAVPIGGVFRGLLIGVGIVDGHPCHAHPAFGEPAR